jgi:hypothetical protein
VTVRLPGLPTGDPWVWSVLVNGDHLVGGHVHVDEPGTATLSRSATVRTPWGPLVLSSS